MEEERSVNADAHSSRSLYTRIRYVAAQFSSHMQAFALASPWHLHIRGLLARPDSTPDQGLAIFSVKYAGMIHQSGLPNLQPSQSHHSSISLARPTVVLVVPCHCLVSSTTLPRFQDGAFWTALKVGLRRNGFTHLPRLLAVRCACDKVPASIS